MSAFEKRCMHCMEPITSGDRCLICGYQLNTPQIETALPYGTVLQSRYLIGKAKASVGQGFCYTAFDLKLENRIEIHEFFPKTLCNRNADGISVLVNETEEEMFEKYLAEFLTCARAIAQMRKYSEIEQIYDIFEEKNTAYTVTDWNEHVTLHYFVERRGGFLDWNSARQLFMPVLTTLSLLHEKGIAHYGISTNSLHILEDGTMKLGDFFIHTVRQVGNGLPADIVSGCGAPEQYQPGETLTEATDVYGFSASLFFALTGMLPENAKKRTSDVRLIIPNSILKELPPHVVTSLANGLQVDPEKRIPTFERLRVELSAAPNITAVIEETLRIPKITDEYLEKNKPIIPIVTEKEKKGGLPIAAWIVISAIAMLAVMLVVFFLFIYSTPNNNGGKTIPLSSEYMSSTQDLLENSDVSSTTQQITVPDLTNQKYTDVVTYEANNPSDYEVLRASTDVFSDSVPEGVIVSQTPKAGTQMTKGGSIVVVVSKGSATRVLPVVAGLSVTDATKKLTDDGFIVSPTYQTSSTVPAGTVIDYQGHSAGDKLQYRASVTIIVSTGS